MPLFKLLNRERGIIRGRTRPHAPGNFVTVTHGITVGVYVYQPTPENYIKYETYESPYPKAFGYRDGIPPKPLWVPIGVLTQPGQTIPNPIPTITQFTSPTNPGTSIVNNQASNLTVNAPQSSVAEGRGIPFKPGDANKIVPGTVPSQIIGFTYPIGRVTILADALNVGIIWVKYAPDVAIGNGFPLDAGIGRDFDVDDLSSLYFVGENATDAYYFIYER